MQNKKGRKQSSVHFGAQINKHQQAWKTVAQWEEDRVSYCFEWQLLLRIIVVYVNFELPFVRLEGTPLGKMAYALCK